MKYTDPTGAFDFEDFFKGIGQLFTNKSDFQNKFSEYYEFPYNPDTYKYEEGDIYSSYGNKVSVIRKTEYGKMTNYEKLQVLQKEWYKLAQIYEDNKSSGIDSLESLFYGTGEVLFSFGSYSSLDEFCLNLFGNNLENIGDIAQFDLDEINLLIQMKIVENEFNKVYEEYLNE